MARLFTLCCRQSTVLGSKGACRWDGIKDIDGPAVQLVQVCGEGEEFE